MNQPYLICWGRLLGALLLASLLATFGPAPAAQAQDVNTFTCSAH